MRVWALTWLQVLIWVGSAHAGQLVLIGGGKRPPEAMQRFIALAGGTEAEIVVLPTASEDPETPAAYLKLFNDFGCNRVKVLAVHSREDAFQQGVLSALETCGGLFFTGGDQRRITAALLGTPLMAVIERRFAEDLVVGGTSAGTACMSALMLTGDGKFDRLSPGNVGLSPGLGLVRGLVLDQHFVARSRHARLLSVILEHPDLLGVGIDEDTALWIKSDGSFDVLGNGWVEIYDARGSSSAARFSDRLAARGLLLHVLVAGDHFDPAEPFKLEKASGMAKEQGL